MSYYTLHPYQVEEFLKQEDIVVLDHRDPTSYKNQHLPGAMQVNEPLIKKLIKTNRKSKILIYCYHGNSSKDLSMLFINFGFKQVYNLEGGWQAWKSYNQNSLKMLSNSLTKWLRDQNFNPDNIHSCIENGMSALMQAAFLAERSYVSELLESGIDINSVNNDRNNALWFACVSEDIVIIDKLIASGIEINNCNVNGASALIYAASSGKYNVVTKLVEAGANMSHTTLDGFNALDSASTIKILKYLKPYYVAA